jgi:hypothetical protein
VVSFFLLITDNIFSEEIVVNKIFVLILTTAYDAIEKAAGALQLAVSMAAFDAKIDFFLMNERASRKFYICTSCVKPYGLECAVFVKTAEVKPGSYLGELPMKRQGLTF